MKRDVTTKSVAKFAGLIAVLAGLFALAWRYNLPLAELRTLVAGIPATWQHVAFIALYALVSVAPVPGRDVVKLTGAFLYGGLFSGFLVYLGELGAAAAAWVLGRALGRDLVERLLRGRLQVMQDKIRGATWTHIALLRVFPGTPYRFMNYAAGVSEVRGAPYFIGTAAGTLPRTLAFQLLFASAGDTLAKRGVTTFQVVLVSVGFAVLVGLVLLIRQNRKSRQP